MALKNNQIPNYPDLRESPDEQSGIPNSPDLRASYMAPNAIGGKRTYQAAQKAHDMLQKKANQLTKKTAGKAKDSAVDATGTAANALKNLKRAREKGLTTREGLKELNKAAVKVGSAIAADLLGNPEFAPIIEKVWNNKWKILLAVVLLIFLLFMMISDDNHASLVAQQQQQLQTQGITSNISCSPASLRKPGETTVCSITVTLPPMADNVVVTDYILDGSDYVPPQSSLLNLNGVYDLKTKTVTWNLQNLSTAPTTQTVSVTLKSTKPNWKVFNTYTINPGNVTGSSVPANNNNCHGIYTHWMSMVQNEINNPKFSKLNLSGANYGDPSCQLVSQDPNGNWIINKDKILAFLKDSNGAHLTPLQAEGLFICIIPFESSYNADALNPGSTSATSGGTPGAFGLFQMNAKGYSNQGQPEDVGDVVWNTQITNAITWTNNYHGGVWHGLYNGKRYWPASYDGCLSSYGL